MSAVLYQGGRFIAAALPRHGPPSANVVPERDLFRRHLRGERTNRAAASGLSPVFNFRGFVLLKAARKISVAVSHTFTSMYLCFVWMFDVVKCFRVFLFFPSVPFFRSGASCPQCFMAGGCSIGTIVALSCLFSHYITAQQQHCCGCGVDIQVFLFATAASMFLFSVCATYRRLVQTEHSSFFPGVWRERASLVK